ncbi:REC8 meiotic recombination protein b [Amia ocellicauda]|uniref:REC8 meiotic recombination protein b n=1 Tax=Amia ocellicauda TaxID=2972642 RepID=UPI003463B97C
MFYYPDVLQRHTGCFSIIWLAATKGIRITRRDYMKVNVKRTCDHIVEFVLVRVEPPQAGLPRPRFSLYLSSQLQYGVVLVYHRQCAILLEEIQHILDRLLRSEAQLRIDMAEPDKLLPTLPDPLSVLEASEGALDPFFGVMEMDGTLPSPFRLPQLQKVLEAETPERSPVDRDRTAPEQALIASPESITMREEEPRPIIEFEGLDLLEVTPSEIDLLMEQPDTFPLEREREGERGRERGRGAERERRRERGREERVRGPEREEEERERVREAERERTRELTETLASVEQLRESTTAEPDVLPLMDEDTRPLVARPVAMELEVTPPVSIALPPSPPERERDEERRRERERVREVTSPEVCLCLFPSLSLSLSLCLSLSLLPLFPSQLTQLSDLSEIPKRRRRQLRFLDPHTQISQDVLRLQIGDPRVETRPLYQVVIKPPRQRRCPPAEIFNTPCTSLHPDILSLWQECAVVTPIPPSAWRKRELEREREREREREDISETEVRQSRGRWPSPPWLRWRCQVRAAASSLVLVPAGAVSLPRCPHCGVPVLSVPSELLLELSEEERSRSLITPEGKWSPLVEVPALLELIPEERAEPREEEELTTQSLLRLASQFIRQFREVAFHTLLPLEADRKTAGSAFYILLELLAAKILSAFQEEPFGPIVLSPGALYPH